MEKTTVKVATTNNNIFFPSTYTHKNIYISCAVRSEIGKKIRDELLKDGFNVLDRRSSVKIGDNLRSNIGLCSDLIWIIDQVYDPAYFTIEDTMKKDIYYAFEQQKHIIPIIKKSLSDDLSKRHINDDKMSSYLRSTMCLTISDSFTDEDYTKLKEALVVTSISKAQAEQKERKIERKKSIDDIVSGLKTDKIEREHCRVQWWYWMCNVLFVGLLTGFGFYMSWNLQTISSKTDVEGVYFLRTDQEKMDSVKIQINSLRKNQLQLDSLKKEITKLFVRMDYTPTRAIIDSTLFEQQAIDSLSQIMFNITDDYRPEHKGSSYEISISEIIIRILISMSFLSMIFVLMNQAARSRKNLVLLSKEIQEYKYIGALLKGKVDMSTNEEDTNKSIDKTFDEMIKLHLDIQRQRLEKEDHTEVKDITPDILNFFKENTSTMMGNFNEMQKNILDLHKTIVQTLKDDKDKK